MKILRFTFIVLVLGVFSLLNGSWDNVKDDTLEQKAQNSVKKIKNLNPKLNKFFNNAYAYAIYPTVGKAGFGIGGAYGEGVVYAKNKVVGYSKLTQLSIGFQFGGQAYSEILFFKDKSDLELFKKGNFELSAQASAVAITAGASVDLDYNNGVAIFTMAKGGLMYEASVGGQKFTFDERK